jgi:hypoxanthine phosphoribosyltransferase
MRILIDGNRLQTRISEMALEINEYYQKQDWYQRTQEPVIVIGVLTGALFFMADLVRQLSIRTELDFIRVSTYPGKTMIAQEPKIINLPTLSLQDAHVLLVDDILDTGKTIGRIREHLAWPYIPQNRNEHIARISKNMRTAVLLRKPGKAPAGVTADFVGFDVPDKFLVGYGLDYDSRHREKPYVAVWSEDGFETSEK